MPNLRNKKKAIVTTMIVVDEAVKVDWDQTT